MLPDAAKGRESVAAFLTSWLDAIDGTMEPGSLKRHQDNLSGKHGNCQIPKLIGSAARYGYTAVASDLVAAWFFDDRVGRRHR